MFESLNPFFVRTPPPDEEINEVVDLIVYPILSCRGTSVKKSFLTKKGLELDGRWMFVDAKTNQPIIAKEEPKLSQISTAFASNSQTSFSNPSPSSPHGTDAEFLVITIPSRPAILIPSRPTSSWLGSNTFLNRSGQRVYGEDVNEAFGRFIGRGVQLVYDEVGERRGVIVSYEGETVEKRRRANVLVRGKGDESEWRVLKVRKRLGHGRGGSIGSFDSAGDVEGEKGLLIDVRLGCDCQGKGDRDGLEPWFGMLGSPKGEGPLSVGMRLEVVERGVGHKCANGTGA